MSNLCQDLQHIIYSYLQFEEILQIFKFTNTNTHIRDKFIRSQKPLIPSITESLKNGYFETLKYSIDNSINMLAWHNVTYNALKYGHLEIFKYFHDIESTYLPKSYVSEAISFKHLEILDYLFSIGDNPKETLYTILRDDNLEIFKLYQKNFGVSGSFINGCSRGTEIYEYLYKQKYG